MPETPQHELAIELLVGILRFWIARTGLDAMAGRNIAVRFDRKHPSRGIDPDVYLVSPAPPLRERETSLCLWKKGHLPPRLAVEVVSEGTASKDYLDAPARYAASGVRELWIFDPLRFGAPDSEGPWPLQVWRRMPKGAFKRVYAGEGPAFSRELGAWVVVTDEGARLRIADDAAGAKRWPTHAEHAESIAAEKDARLLEKDAELARLRALLASKSGREG